MLSVQGDIFCLAPLREDSGRSTVKMNAVSILSSRQCKHFSLQVILEKIGETTDIVPAWIWGG